MKRPPSAEIPERGAIDHPEDGGIGELLYMLWSDWEDGGDPMQGRGERHLSMPRPVVRVRNSEREADAWLNWKHIKRFDTSLRKKGRWGKNGTL